jgi:polyisoprenoid-binding protein YceI
MASRQTAAMLRRLFLLLAATAAAALRADDRALVVDPVRSTVEVDVHATFDSFVGHVSLYDASVIFDAARGRPKAATLRFNFTALKTGRMRRDADMLDWLGGGAPTGSFELLSLEPGPADRLLARGRLTIHDVTQPVEFPVTLTIDHELCAIDGQTLVDTRQFNLPVLRMFLVLRVDPVVHVHFHLQGELPPAS